MTNRLSNDVRYIVFNDQPKIIRKWSNIRYMCDDCDDWYHIYRWIEKNTNGYWAIKGTMVYFKSIEDAVACKLRWC